jgi:hypothetical protein
VGGGKRVNKMMSGFGRENTRGRRSPKKEIKRIGTNNDFDNLIYSGKNKQKMQKVVSKSL